MRQPLLQSRVRLPEEHILGILRMLGLKESHSQQHNIALNYLLVACRFHLRTTAVWIGNPLNSLNLNALKVALAVIQELV